MLAKNVFEEKIKNVVRVKSDKTDLNKLAKEASEKGISYGQLMVERYTKTKRYR